jgi:hypothetical protein
MEAADKKRKVCSAKCGREIEMDEKSTNRICADAQYSGFTAVFNRLNFRTRKRRVDAKLSDLSKKVPPLRYFAAQIFIKGEKGGDIPDAQTKK